MNKLMKKFIPVILALTICAAGFTVPVRAAEIYKDETAPETLNTFTVWRYKYEKNSV
jgi:hypothetical protein